MSSCVFRPGTTLLSLFITAAPSILPQPMFLVKLSKIFTARRAKMGWKIQELFSMCHTDAQSAHGGLQSLVQTRFQDFAGSRTGHRVLQFSMVAWNTPIDHNTVSSWEFVAAGCCRLRTFE